MELGVVVGAGVVVVVGGDGGGVTCFVEVVDVEVVVVDEVVVVVVVSGKHFSGHRPLPSKGSLCLQSTHKRERGVRII